MGNNIRYLMESANKVATGGKKNITVPTFYNMLSEDRMWDRYIRTFMEAMADTNLKKEFRLVAENTRKALLEQAVTGNISYYETLTFPVLSVFYPRLISRELVTVTPIDKPEVIKGFLKPYFRQYGSNQRQLGPVYGDVSSGPKTQLAGNAAIQIPTKNPFDLLAPVNLTSDIANIELGSFKIVAVTATLPNGQTETVNTQIYTTVDGNISETIYFPSLGVNDTIQGYVDQKQSTFVGSSVSGYITSISVQYVIGVEQNTVSSTVEFDIEKIRLVVKDRQITARWTIQFEQDLKALYDIDLQSQIVAIIGQQIALDIDKEIVNQLIFGATQLNGPNHQDVFNVQVPPGFAFGPKEWYKNIILNFNQLANTIYAETNIKPGNVIAVNPIDAVLLEAFDDFAYSFNSPTYDGAEIAFKTASLAGGKYKVLVSPVVPQGSMVMALKSDQEIEAVYYYCTYVPILIHPYPMNNVPTVSMLTRYANTFVRPQGVAMVQIQGTAAQYNNL